jgi:hypothetical protein
MTLGAPQIDRAIGIDRADGRRIWLSVSIRLLDPDHPEHSPAQSTFHDVTEQKLASDRLAHVAQSTTPSVTVPVTPS